MKRKINNYNTGGDILSTVSMLSPLLNLIPGGQIAAPIVGGLAGMGAGMMNKQDANQMNLNPTQYNNTKSFGYATGGNIQPISNNMMHVTGAPNEVDGNSIMYKGNPINVDHNEMIDTEKDRVFSDKYFNPLTGKKISDESKSIANAKKRLESKKNDSLHEATEKHLNLQSDALFGIQEAVATLAGDRPQAEPTQTQSFYSGGNIQNKRNYLENPGDPTEPGVPNSVFQNILQGVNPNQDYPIEQVGTPKPSAAEQGRFIYENGLDEAVPMLSTSLTKKPLVSMNNPVANLAAQMKNINTTSAKTSGISNENIFSQMSTGDKIQGGVALASMIPKAIEAFSKVQKDPYRTVDTPLTLQQMDPTQALYNSQNQYNAQVNDIGNRVTSNNTRNALSANAYAQKLNSDNQVLGQYEQQNKSLMSQYQDRIAQRQAMNNQSMMQTDDLNSRNRGTREQMRMGFYGDVAGAGQFLGNSLNERKKQQMQFDAMKTLTPDVIANFLKSNPDFAKMMKIK